jgi:hypothetical protein
VLVKAAMNAVLTTMAFSSGTVVATSAVLRKVMGSGQMMPRQLVWGGTPALVVPKGQSEQTAVVPSLYVPGRHTSQLVMGVDGLLE